MGAQVENPILKIHRVRSTREPEFDALVSIHYEAQPESERKSQALLSRMIERPEYFFLTVLRDGSVLGFSISICLVDSDAALLEYMAVAAEHRNHGIGRRLFEETVNFHPISERPVLIEVDSDKVPSPDRENRVRRKAFYRSLGCREIEGLAYVMPRVSSAAPPPMEMLVYSKTPPASIEKTRLRNWLENCYSQVYQRPHDDRRIDSMLEKLPDNLKLI